MLLEEVWPLIEKSENQLALMKAFKFPVIFYNKDKSYNDFFSTHTAAKVLSGDINAPLYVLMCTQLMELNRGIYELSTISERAYKDTEVLETNGVDELQAQFILLNHFWEHGTKLFVSFLKYGGGEAETEILRKEIKEFRRKEQEIYAILKPYEPFKIHDLNGYFINVGKTIKQEKEEFNTFIKNYSSLVLSMRCFSTFLNLLPNAIRMPSSKNYLALLLSERISPNSITYLEDNELIKYFIPEISRSCAENLEKEGKVSKNYLFADKIVSFLNDSKHLFDSKEKTIFLDRNKYAKEHINYSYCDDIKESDLLILEKQMELLKNNIYEKSFSDLSAKPKDFIILDKISLQNWEEKIDKKNLIKESFSKYMSLVNGAAIISTMYENFLIKTGKDKIKDKSDKTIDVEDSFAKGRKKFIRQEVKSIQSTLMLGNNVKYMKDLFAIREDGESLNKKLQIFYMMRKAIAEKNEEKVLNIDELSKIRCMTKGMEYVLFDMKDTIEEDLRYMKLKAVTSSKKEVKKSKKKI